MSLREDYFRVFLATPEGRRVLCDLDEYARNFIRGDGDIPADKAIAQLAVDDFVREIHKKCGIDNPEARLALLAKECEVAGNYLLPKEEESEEDILKP